MKGSQVCLCVAVMTYCPPTYSYTSYGESCEPKLVLVDAGSASLWSKTMPVGQNGGARGGVGGGGDGAGGGGDGGGMLQKHQQNLRRVLVDSSMFTFPSV